MFVKTAKFHVVMTYAASKIIILTDSTRNRLNIC